MKTRTMMYVAMFAGVVGVLGLLPPIPIPISPVPVTAQTLGVMLAGSLLGARMGGGSMLLVLGLIAAGMPLLSGGRGGLGVLLGPSGGYILSWPIAAFVIGWLMERFLPRLHIVQAVITNVIGGVVIIHICGTLYLAYITDISIAAAAVSTLGFLPGDSLKAVVASYTAVKIANNHPSLLKGYSNKKTPYKAAG
ncbi:biotin transporter BioY [Salibacterium salarium]|uniref:Biotin transporter n=1 Tax=Salibacterium salarium TaxID=284579 RepID=A0A428MVP2_9BACI|nr:biotin transporter BioY [Salibacterium salarium]RSL30174.1 biotin transporter BioY [Salibacterium salarium]